MWSKGKHSSFESCLSNIRVREIDWERVGDLEWINCKEGEGFGVETCWGEIFGYAEPDKHSGGWGVGEPGDGTQTDGTTRIQNTNQIQ